MNKQAKSLLFASIAILLISAFAIYLIFAAELTYTTMNGYGATYNSSNYYSAINSSYYSPAVNNTLLFNITTTSNFQIVNVSFNVSGLTFYGLSTDVPTSRNYSVVNDSSNNATFFANLTEGSFLIDSDGGGVSKSQIFTLYLNATGGDGGFNINITTVTAAGTRSYSYFNLVIDTLVPAKADITQPSVNENISSRAFAVDVNMTDPNRNYTNISIINAAGVVVASAFNNTINRTNAHTNVTFNFTTLGLGDGRYVINVSAYDKAGNRNSTNITVTVDTNPPAVILTSPADGEATNSTGNYYTIKATITDATIGTISTVFFNLTNWTGTTGQNMTFGANLTNVTLGHYINATGFNLTSYPDGAYNITVYANDTLNNLNKTVVHTMYIDRTPPTSVTTAALTTAQTVLNFSITIVDATSGVNASCTATRSGGAATITGTALVQNAYESGLNCATAYTYTVLCRDKAGNVNTTGTYTATTSDCTVAASSSGGGMPSSAITYSVDLASTGAIAARSLRVNDGLKFTVNTVSHSVAVKTVSAESVTVLISSTPMEAVIKSGETKKFDLDADGVYDIAVRYNGLLNSVYAKIEVTRIAETMTAAEEAEQAAQEAAAAAAAGEAEKEKAGMSIKAIVWIAVAVIIIAAIVWYLMRKRK